VAAVVHDRRWVGIELSENYCEIAKQRIQSFVDQKSQQKLQFENGVQ
jgi:DNA modification methylase